MSDRFAGPHGAYETTDPAPEESAPSVGQGDGWPSDDDTDDTDDTGDTGDTSDIGDGLTITSLRDGHTITSRSSLTRRMVERSVHGTKTARRAPGTRWRLWYRLATSVALVAVTLAGLFVWLQPSLAQFLRPAKPPAPVVFSIGAFHCADDAVWSPDSSHIAALSESGCSPFGGTAPPTPSAQKVVLTIYDAHTGHARSSVEINAIVARHIAFPASAKEYGQIIYSQLLWMPDEKHILVSFSAYEIPIGGGATQLVANGLAIVPVALANPTMIRVLFGPTVVNIGPTDPATPMAFERWNLTSGVFDVIHMPLAVVYRWTRSDTLSPISPVASWTSLSTLPEGVVGGAVGNPLGGIQFSLWQSGYIQYDSANGCDGPQGLGHYSPQDIYEIDMNTPTISPDGRYLIPAIYAQGRLPAHPPQPVPTATSSTLLPPTNFGCTAATDAQRLPQLPIRDAGLHAALSLVTMNTQPLIQFTWRPDGARLAVAPGEVDTGAPALTIYDCATGKIRAQFSLAQIETLAHAPLPDGGSPFQIVRWSPDGAHLLVLPQGVGAQAIIFASATLGG